MALIRWEPTREIESLQQEVNRLFGSFFDVESGGRQAATGARRWLPAVDLVEEDDHYVLHADLPGVKPEDVSVELQDDVLTISGNREASSRSEQNGVHRRERAHGAFSRTLTLPAGIDPDSIAASFEQGVLEVRIPKPQEQKPHRVSIQVGAHAPVVEGAESEQGALSAS
ncbi:MAG: Hsp20/alpha crystallin family protein [Solirubrobacteraceae bacterium]